MSKEFDRHLFDLYAKEELKKWLTDQALNLRINAQLCEDQGDKVNMQIYNIVAKWCESERGKL